MAKAQVIAEKMQKGIFDLDDLADQIKQMQRMGGMGGVMGMMPGVAKMKNQLAESGMNDAVLKRQHAIITSMTGKERRNPKLLDAKRKRRIASGSGTKVEEINRLLKQHRQMADMMKMMGKNPSMLKKMAGAMGMPMPGAGAPSEAEMAKMQAELSKLDPRALEQLPAELKDALPKGLSAPPAKSGGLPGLTSGLPGLGGGFPKFPGFLGKKK
jgi:signal recognition particle subunit SRP54